MTRPNPNVATENSSALTGEALRLVGTQGSNRIMAGELSRLVRRAYNDIWVPEPQKDGPGSIVYPMNARMARVALEYHRTCARVLWQFFTTRSTRLEPLYAELCAALNAQWPSFLQDGQGLSVQAHQVEAFQAGERQIVGTVKNALIESARARGVSLRLEPENPDLLIDVRGGENGLVVSLDISGRAMHLRGYRQVAGAAPLREDVAALLVMLMRHDSRREPLFDPFAGAGTIGIEASLLAQGAPNWCAGRRPQGAVGTELDALLREPLPALFGDTLPCVLMSDEDPEACSAAERNLQMAGITELRPVRADFRSWSPARLNEYCQAQGKPGPGVIVSNPPYGERLGDAQELLGMYRELGRWCRQFRGWRAGFLVANPDFEEAFGQRAVSKKPLFNGPLRATFYQYQL